MTKQDAVVADEPLVVWVDGHSASSSEVSPAGTRFVLSESDRGGGGSCSVGFECCKT